jgi:triacylglycerol lipase
MKLESRPIPPPEIAKLIPPDPLRAYFDFGPDVPFAAQSTDFSLVNAVWLMEASFASYKDEKRPANLDRLTALGWKISFPDEGNAQCLVLDGPEAVILAFRGTRVEGFVDPITRFRFVNTNLHDMLANFNFLPHDPGDGRKVHRGFNQALELVYPKVKNMVNQIKQQSLNKQIWCTGHSLGAALATLAADRLSSVFPIKGLYTFGSPRVGNAEFCRTFPVGNTYRFVDNRDLVTKVPPEVLYSHIGHLKYLTDDGRLMDTEEKQSESSSLKEGFEFWRLAKDAAVRDAHLNNMSTWAVTSESLADHAPIYYANKIWNLLVKERNG